METKEHVFSVRGNENCGVATEKRVCSFLKKKLKIKKELQPSNSMSWYLSRDNRNNTLYTPYAYCSTIYNSQYKKVTSVYIDRGLERCDILSLDIDDTDIDDIDKVIFLSCKKE